MVVYVVVREEICAVVCLEVNTLVNKKKYIYSVEMNYKKIINYKDRLFLLVK